MSAFFDERQVHPVNGIITAADILAKNMARSIGIDEGNRAGAGINELRLQIAPPAVTEDSRSRCPAVIRPADADSDTPSGNGQVVLLHDQIPIRHIDIVFRIAPIILCAERVNRIVDRQPGRLFVLLLTVLKPRQGDVVSFCCLSIKP